MNTLGSYRCDCAPGFTGSDCSMGNLKIVHFNSNTFTCTQFGITLVSFFADALYRSMLQISAVYEGCSLNPRSRCFSMYSTWSRWIQTVYLIHGAFRRSLRLYYYFFLFRADTDECLTAVCQTNVNCVNTLGSYRCDCAPGFSGSDCSMSNLKLVRFLTAIHECTRHIV